MSLDKLTEEIILHFLSFLSKTSDIIHFSITNKKNKDFFSSTTDVSDNILLDKSNYNKIISKITTKTKKYELINYFLPKIYKINLSYCQGIKDVSMLGNVENIDLSGCRGISDISMLGNIETLNLSTCFRITDVSMLINFSKYTKND